MPSIPALKPGQQPLHVIHHTRSWSKGVFHGPRLNPLQSCRCWVEEIIATLEFGGYIDVSDEFTIVDMPTRALVLAQQQLYFVRGQSQVEVIACACKLGRRDALASNTDQHHRPIHNMHLRKPKLLVNISEGRVHIDATCGDGCTETVQEGLLISTTAHTFRCCVPQSLDHRLHLDEPSLAQARDG